MNREHPTPPEANKEAFWDGHTFNDNCPWETREFGLTAYDIPVAGLALAVATAVPEMRKRNKEDKETYKKLQEFLSTQSGAPIKRLSEGHKFSASDLPKGTIIHLDKDIEIPALNGRISRGTFWGIITQGKNADGTYYDKVSMFREEAFDRNHHFYRMPTWTLSLSDEHTIGETKHTRTRFERPLGKDKSESLERLNWVEVWQLGQELRETAKEKGTVGKFFARKVTS